MLTAFADVDFYTTQYLKGREPSIPLSEFDAWALSASMEINRNTIGRAESLVTEYEEIRHATCELAEIMFINNMQLDPNNRQIRSKSVDGFSTVYADIALSVSDYNAKILRVQSQWLGNIWIDGHSIFYRG